MADPILRPVPLDTPIKRGETAIATITLRKPKSGELRGLSLVQLGQLDAGELMKLIPRISDPILTDAEVAEMDPADLLSCGVEVSDFLLGTRGNTDSPTTSKS